MGSYKHPDCGHVFLRVGDPKKKYVGKQYKWATLYRCKFCRDSRLVYKDESLLFPEAIYSKQAKEGQEGGGKIVRYYTPSGHSDYNKNSCFSPLLIFIILLTSISVMVVIISV